MTSLSSTPVMLIHGAGLDASSFGPFAELLRRSGFDPISVTRKGYDGTDPKPMLEDHVGDLVDVLDGRTPASVVAVGVSGGATLGLMLALRHHPSLARVIVHEPLVGPLAPEQNRVIATSIATFLADRSSESFPGFLERLVTPSGWSALPNTVRDGALQHEAVVRAEAPGFAQFALDTDCLLRPHTPILWTVGRHSPAWRHDAAAVGVSLGCEIKTLDACHTPQLEDPAGLLDAICSSGA